MQEEMARQRYTQVYKEFLQQLKDKHPNSKMGKGLEWTFPQRRYITGQLAHEKMFNITNHLVNENQNHSEKK